MSATRHIGDVPWQDAIAALIAALDRDGEETRVIGGAVRNLLLGVPIGDIDIATTALPDEVVRRAQKLGLRTVPTGIEHGTVTVILDGRPYEVTTLREDVETFGRHARVRFGRDWVKDAQRRDFTINALSMTRSGEVFDYVGGLADIERRHVRFIGDARARIREDYLRVLRFFRFHAAYGSGQPDPAGVAASIAERGGLASLSRERVRVEMLKLLGASGAVDTIATMAETGLLSPILGVPIPPHLARLAAMEEALGLPPDPIRRLGVLALHVAEDAERLGERLRLSSAERDRLALMVTGWRSLITDLGENAARVLLYRCGGDRTAFLDRLLFAWARAEADPQDPNWTTAARLPDRWTPPRFPLRGADFIARGIAKGPALGRALTRAEDEWIAAGFPEDANAIAVLADKWAAR